MSTSTDVPTTTSVPDPGGAPPEVVKDHGTTPGAQDPARGSRSRSRS
ncbi:hypothetical protein [Nocardioides zeae]